jgi:hypothetical protein
MYVGDGRAVAEPHAGGAAAPLVDHDLGHLGREPELAPELLEQPREPGDHRSRAAHGEPHPPLLLEVVDERIDGRALERVAADEQGMEAEHLPQPLVLDVAADEAGHRLVRLQPDQVPGHAHHVAEAMERLVDQREASLEDLLGGRGEAQVAVHVVRVEPPHLADDLLASPGVAKHRAVLEPDVVVRLHRDELHVVRGPLPAEGEQLVD